MTPGIGLFCFFRTPFADSFRSKAHNNFRSTLNPTGPLSAAPGPTSATTTEDYGVGAFLLAGRQVQLLVK